MTDPLFFVKLYLLGTILRKDVKMFQRSAAALVQRLAQIFPVISITGPRQSGKTTLAKELFAQFPYVSLENLDIRHEALNDPRAFFSSVC